MLFVPIQFTSVENDSAARIACMCESIRPGTTVRPCRSITRVVFAISGFSFEKAPRATMRPSRIASA